MTNLMLINATVADELRVAVVKDGELVDLDIESSKRSTIKGNIYKGVIHNVEGSLAAAFVDYGAHKQGFLPFDEVSDEQFCKPWKGKDEPRITDVLRRGQDVIVQVDKDAVGEKGAALTTYTSLAGRYTVLMPGSDARGVSRKITDDADRKKIRAMADKIDIPEDCGYIVRTAGLGRTKAVIQKDLDQLVKRHEEISKAGKIARAPSLLYKEPDIIGRTLRDLFNDEIDEVWIDSRNEYETAREYFEELMPEAVDRLRFWENPIPMFAYHHVESQIEETFDRNVPLPSGGSIVIDRTEALVAIDVNSGKMTSEKGHEDTVYKTNFEAAQVIARQLRLRDLGGIVVVDFIDMEMERNRRAVVKALRNSSKTDKARIKISRITSSGLCILTRQRIRQGIQKSFQTRCPVCDGTGWIRSPESHSLSLLKRIETRLAQGGVGEVRAKTHSQTAEYLLNYRRSELLGLEREYGVKIIIIARADMDRASDEVRFMSMGEVLAEITDKLPSREEMRKKRSSASRRSRKKSPKKSSKKKSSDGESSKSKSRGTSEDSSKSAGGPVPEPSVPGGPTFTGKPSKEMLEKIKAERAARMAARKAKKASPEASDNERTDSGEPAAASTPTQATDKNSSEANEKVDSEQIETKKPAEAADAESTVSESGEEATGPAPKKKKKAAARKKTTNKKTKSTRPRKARAKKAAEPESESAEPAVAAENVNDAKDEASGESKKPGLLDRLLGRNASQDEEEK
ncbi:MAG: Rne/Rng family ribonuclease [Myxococcota bacterium]|nr:Rne/Rng family ribonuclease [Myxococcota bacterium]